MDIILLFSYFFRFVSFIDDIGLFCGLLRLILMVIIFYVYFYICICCIIELMKKKFMNFIIIDFLIFGI